MLYSDKKVYGKYVKGHAKPSPLLRDFAAAFLVGGLICGAGELASHGIVALGVPLIDARRIVSLIIIFLASLLTALGVFDNIARFAGAGTIVPVCGFSNSVASSAIDSKSEGLVLGVGAKIVTVAGPVLLYGTLAGTLWGIVYYIISLF